jgi:hypothetical protein
MEQIQMKLSENYYLEDDRKLLNILIKNCYPIISDLLQQIVNFNTYNQAFDLKITDTIVTEGDQNLRELIQFKD